MSDDATEGADRATGPETGLTMFGSAEAGSCADGMCVRPPQPQSD